MYYAFDSSIVSRYRNTKLKMGKFKKDNLEYFTEDYFSKDERKWEVRFDNSYPNVFYDPDLEIYRCFYTAIVRDESSETTPLKERMDKVYQISSNRITAMLYAESKNGVDWFKPSLGRVSFNGTKDNNIVFIDCHGGSVFYDEHTLDDSRRYKLVMKDDADMKMKVTFSADGYDWSEPLEWPRYNVQGDTHNFAFWDDRINKYVLITRQWDGVRLVARSTSEDFINWSKPEIILRGDGLNDQIYSMPIFKLQTDMYLALPSIFRGGDMDDPLFDLVDCELAYSHNGEDYERILRGQSFIPRGLKDAEVNEADSSCIYASAPVLTDNGYRFYYMGGNGQHTNFRETTLMSGTLEKDKFAGWTNNEDRIALVETRPVTFYENSLYLVADLEDDSILDVSIHNNMTNLFKETDELVKGQVSFDSSKNMYKVEFPEGEMVDLIRNRRNVQLVFSIKNAVLYGFEGGVNLKVKRNDI